MPAEEQKRSDCSPFVTGNMAGNIDEQAGSRGAKHYRELAAECLQNASDLHKDASLLLKHDRYARAFALAVIADEELAKTIIYTIAAMGHQDLFPGLGRVLGRHRAKQDVAAFAAVLAEATWPAFEEIWNVSALVAKGEIDTGAEDPEDYALRRGVQRMQQAARDRPRDSDKQSEPAASAVQELKNACFYVDSIPDGLSTPATSCPNPEEVRDYTEGVQKRLTFVSYMIAGNFGKEEAQLKEGERKAISDAWLRMRERYRL